MIIITAYGRMDCKLTVNSLQRVHRKSKTKKSITRPIFIFLPNEN